MIPGKSYLPALNRFARGGSAVTIAVGTTVLTGWLLHIEVLKSVLPGLESMKVNTACGFVIAGVALWLLHTRQSRTGAYRLARILALLVTVVAALTLAQDIFGFNLGIDEFVMRGRPVISGDGYPGRMAPITSFNFFVIGSALLGLKAKDRRTAACAHWITILPLFLSMVAILGYSYGVSSLYHVKPFSSMALHTALTFFALILAIKAADPMHGIANIMASDTAGGLVCRRLLPIMPPALFALGYLRLLGQREGLYDTAFGLALMVAMSTTLCIWAVVWTSYALRKVDLTRQRAEAEIIGLNVGLEQLSGERIERLAELAMTQRENKYLERQSLHDGLTDIANRRAFDAHLAAQFAISRRHNRPLALVLCDLDGFKAYNDRYGHQAGDICLKLVAATLQSCCKRPGDMAARYGGEEFGLILPDTDLAGAVKIAESARKAVIRLKIPHGGAPTGSFVSISGGIAVRLQGAGTTVEQLIAGADQSLYDAKRGGRNRMVSEHGFEKTWQQLAS